MEREYFPCNPDDVDCPFRYTGCREDVHHYYQNPVETRLQRIFRNLHRNTADTCRWFHVKVLDVTPREYPVPEVMRSEIMDAEAQGEIQLSENKRRVVYGT